jgi:hypothetical protein
MSDSAQSKAITEAKREVREVLTTFRAVKSRLLAIERKLRQAAKNAEKVEVDGEFLTAEQEFATLLWSVRVEDLDEPLSELRGSVSADFRRELIEAARGLPT